MRIRQNEGALATQTQVIVGSVEFSPLTGEGAIFC